MAKQTLSQADKEAFDALIQESFGKARQFEAEDKKIRDRRKAMFAKLAQHDITKQAFNEAFKRSKKDAGQLDMFDTQTMRIETVMREVMAERVTEEQDRAEEGEKAAKKPKAGKKAAKKTAKAEPGKKIDAASPPDLPTNVTTLRKSHRQPAGFKDKTPRMSAEELNKLQAEGQKPN